MGVEAGVAGAGVPVLERRRDQAVGFDLGDAAGAGAGVGGVVFEQGEGFGDGGFVGGLDGVSDLGALVQRP